MTDKTLKKVDIFISSPGDVGEERRIASEVIEQLNSMPHIADRYLLKPLAYEKIVPAAVGESPQKTVDRYMMEANQADIFICLLWSRMGTPVIDSDGKEYQSGTEYEFINAYQAKEKNGKPCILLYRAMKSIPPDADWRQLGRVQDFFKQFEVKDSGYEGMVKKYENNEKFKEILFQDLDLIITKNIDPITHGKTAPVPVYLPPIESVLNKGKTTEGVFFRGEPEWVDYEQRYIVERKEVNEIINKLKNNDIQLVIGAPASGKSIILKNIGFKLANQNRIYIVELKKHPHNEIQLFFENIPRIDDENLIFIIDDAHLNILDCETLIRNFKGRGKGKLIIGSRDTREITEGDPTNPSVFEHLRKTAVHIHAQDVTEEMINAFLEKQHIDIERIRKASGNLEHFKTDLWNLSWALIAFDSDNFSVDENKIYKNIKMRIEKRNGENVFLPLSIFFRYEIPIERKFLEKQMGIEKGIIEDLIKLQEIVETEEIRKPKMLSLHHSSIADLYFRTYLNYPDLGEVIKEKILNQEDEANLEYCLFYRYLTTITYPRNSVDIVISLARDFSGEKGGLALLKKLITNDQIQDSIKKGIEQEEDLIKVGKCARTIAGNSKEIVIKLADSIFLRIKKESDLLKVGRCLADIAWVDKDIALKFIESVKIRNDEKIENVVKLVSIIANANEEVAMKLVDSVSARLKNEANIEKIREFIEDIKKLNKDIILKFVNSFDIDSILKHIKKEGDIGKIGLLMSDIASISEEARLKLSEGIDIHFLLTKIENEPDIGKIKNCVWGVASLDKNLGMELANLIGIDVISLSTKIEKEPDIENIGRLISAIAWANYEVGLKLSGSINIDVLLSKIGSREDIGTFLKCVSDIASINEAVGARLIVGVSSRIRNEEDLEKIGNWVVDFSRGRKNFPYRLVYNISSRLGRENDIGTIGGCIFVIASTGILNDKMQMYNIQMKLKLIDINALSTKIQEENDIEKIGLLISAIARANKELAEKLVNRIDVNSLSTKIDKVQDIEKIGACVRNIARVNTEVALELVECFSEKIENEHDIKKIGAIVSDIANANEEVALELAECISEKIENEPDIKKIGACISDIARASKELALKLVESVKEQINKEDDIEKIGACVFDITLANVDVGNDLVNILDLQSLYSKTNKETDVDKIAPFILSIASAQEMVAKQILYNLDQKLDEELHKKHPRVYLIKSVW